MESRNTCDGLVHAARKTVEEAGEHANDEEKAAIDAAIATAISTANTLSLIHI